MANTTNNNKRKQSAGNKTENKHGQKETSNGDLKANTKPGENSFSNKRNTKSVEESLSTDSAVLKKVTETQREIQTLSSEVQQFKIMIYQLRDRIPVTDKDATEIQRIQEIIQDKVREMNTLTRRISILLDNVYKPSKDTVTPGKADKVTGVCIKCGQEVCICPREGEHACVCLPGKCICKSGKVFQPGRWRQQQKDLFAIKKPNCICVKEEGEVCSCIGNLDELCPCRQYLRDMEDCVCKRDDHISCKQKHK